MAVRSSVDGMILIYFIKMLYEDIYKIPNIIGDNLFSNTSEVSHFNIIPIFFLAINIIHTYLHLMLHMGGGTKQHLGLP